MTVQTLIFLRSIGTIFLRKSIRIAIVMISSPSLRIAHELKEELITIYNSNITSCGGMRKIKKWLISVRVMLGSAADTLASHIDPYCTKNPIM